MALLEDRSIRSRLLRIASKKCPRQIKRLLKPLVSDFGSAESSKLSSQRRLLVIPSDRYASKESVRIVFTSGCAPRYNGGTKLYNLWVKLLRKNGYEAYIATVDGRYDQWLADHQPVVSYDDVKRFRSLGYDVRIVTAWLNTVGLGKILGNDPFYYFDAEMKWTLYYRKVLDRFLKRGAIAGIATHSRYIQGWYMAKYRIKPILINEWSDTTIFFPAPQLRVPGRVACLAEAREEEEVYQFLRQKCEGSSVCENVVRIQGGDENYEADTMRTADIFVGLNQGKHPIGVRDVHVLSRKPCIVDAFW